MTEDFRSWTRNVIERFKDKTVEEIKEELQATTLPFAVMMENWKGDFNLGTVIRNANGFNAEAVYYFGKKKFDRRGAVGTYHYVNLEHVDNMNQVKSLKEDYYFVGVENNVERECRDLGDYNWALISDVMQRKPLFIFGEEGEGITKELLDLCTFLVSIPMFGSVPSFNAGTASGIVMWDFANNWMKAGPSVHFERSKYYF